MKTPNKNWRLLFTPYEDPYMNMAIDEALSSKCTDSNNGSSIIRFYSWRRSSCSIGYFQKMENVLKTLKNNGVPIVRRPTGGGIVFHDNDITFSIIKRREHDKRLENIDSFYRLVGNSILRGLKRLGFECTFCASEKISYHTEFEKKDLNNSLIQQQFCSITPAKYDILLNGNKVAGYAARRSQETILCQGYLDIYENWKERRDNSHSKMTNLLFKNFVNSFEEVFGITLKHTKLTNEEKALAHQIREGKYACNNWNYRK